ncbi:MAG: BON domain-containing protein [Woeseiaceae bacterium]
MRMLFVVFTSLSLAGCAGMLLGGGSTSERAPASRQSTSPTSADSAISGALRQKYSADREISQYGIGIRAVSGRVTLTGTVGSYEIRDRVVDIAENTSGVDSVDSRVIVNTNMR